MINLYKTLKKGALVTMLGAMSFSAAHAQSKSDAAAPHEKTTTADTATAQALKNQLHNQYESIANVLKTLIQTMNSPEINRKSNAYKNMLKMSDTLMVIIRNKSQLMGAANKLAGKDNPANSKKDAITFDKYLTGPNAKRATPQKTR